MSRLVTACGRGLICVSVGKKFPDKILFSVLVIFLTVAVL